MTARFRNRAPSPNLAQIAGGAVDAQFAVSLAAALDQPRFPWRPSLRPQAEALALKIDPGDRAAFVRGVALEAVSAYRQALEGFRLYRTAKPVRRPAEPPAVWAAGAARLLDFGAELGGATTLVLPSLVNDPRILDLTRARSLMRGLAARGVRPFLLDWGEPGAEERDFDLGLYLRRRVEPALRLLAAESGGPIGVVGHCMSGAMAVAAAQRWPEVTRRAALLAAPWDFAPMTPPVEARPDRAELLRLLEACGAAFGGAPAELLNALFFLLDPLQAMRKFPVYARLSQTGRRARLFVAIEDWLNDGRRLAAPAARELLVDWALDNALAKGRWRPLGAAVRPSRLSQPLLVVASAADTITPEASALAAMAGAPDAERLAPSAGHVGMIVGRRAEAELWNPLAEWLRAG